jgi:dienelactone hydrolase
MPWTHRFLREYLRSDPAAVIVEEITYRRGAALLPARLYRPPNARKPLPGWAVLHGLTRNGRKHRGLDRLARSYAAAGNAVFVPDVPEWRELRVAPGMATLTIRAAVHALGQRPEVRPGHIGLLAFSFGATQAILAGTDPEVAELLQAIVAWGGYADVHATIRFALTGAHEYDGRRTAMEPDPYGCWVFAANYLTAVPGHEADGAVAAALHELAAEAGERGHYAWEPIYDESKLRLRARLPEHQRELFDYLAPPTHRPRRDEPRARDLAERLAAAALRSDPELDPVARLPLLRVPVLLAHGRDDRVIPFPESLRLARLLPAQYCRGCIVTGLFAHSGGTLKGMGALTRAREAARFLGLLHRILNLV